MGVFQIEPRSAIQLARKREITWDRATGPHSAELAGRSARRADGKEAEGHGTKHILREAVRERRKGRAFYRIYPRERISLALLLAKPV